MQKGLSLVPSPGPVDHTRPGLLDNAAVAKVGRGNLRPPACGLALSSAPAGEKSAAVVT